MALTPHIERRLARVRRHTLWGLWVEAALRAFWPLLALALALLGLWRFGLWEMLPPEWHMPARGALALALMLALGLGAWRLRRPALREAERRIDARLPGRPLAGLRDAQAIGRGDAGSEALWAGHQADLARQAARARPARPDLRLAQFDPFGLRLMAALLLGMGLIFGGPAPVGSGAGGPRPQMPAAGPGWEGWAEPPRYTGRPGLYLGDVPAGRLSLPQGTRFSFRLYDEALALEQDISDADPLSLTRSGRLALRGPEGRAWDVVMEPDLPPRAEISGQARAERGEMHLPFAARDDYGLRAGEAQIALDLPQVERRFGLAAAPDPRAVIALDLPMPFRRDRREIEGVLREDLSQHPFAGLPVLVRLRVVDEAGQSGESAPVAMILPAKRFFEPVARALAEQRRDLLWARANGPQVARILRAIGWQPETLFRSEAHGAALMEVISRLEAALADGLPETAREEIAGALWALALELEEGSIEDARERLARAQERLAEAMRSGASKEEIAELMDELRAAKEDYMRLLAESAEPADDGIDQPDQQDESRTVTQDEIDRLMDEIQRLMEEGRMDEAQALMEQLNALLENLRMQEGGSGDGPGRPGEQPLEELQEDLREQQELSDEAFRQLQDQFNDRREAPEAEQGQERSLAERQRILREGVARQQERIEAVPGEDAEAARRALEEAGEAMDEAERALEAEDWARAIDEQGRALEALRRGMLSLRRALSDEAEDEGAEEEPRLPERDPLGRDSGGGGQNGGDALPEEADRGAQAEALLRELRRRLGERLRPEEERDYLRRLLEPF